LADKKNDTKKRNTTVAKKEKKREKKIFPLLNMASRGKNIPVFLVSAVTLYLMIQRGAKWTVPAAIVVGLAGITGMADHAIPEGVLERSAFNGGLRYGRGEGLGYAALFFLFGSAVNEWRDPERKPEAFEYAAVLTACYGAFFMYQGPISNAIKTRRLSPATY